MSDTVERSAPRLRKGPGGRAELADALLPELKAHPGEWRRIKRYVGRPGAWNSRRLFLDQGLLPGCELRAQMLEPDETSFGTYQSGLWARYVGDEAERPGPRPYRRRTVDHDRIRAAAAGAAYDDYTAEESQ